MMKPTSRFRRPALAAALLGATAMSGVIGWRAAPAFAQTTAEHTAPIDVGSPAAQALPGFADLVQKVTPAVVTISSTMREQASDDEASPYPSGLAAGPLCSTISSAARPRVRHRWCTRSARASSSTRRATSSPTTTS